LARTDSNGEGLRTGAAWLWLSFSLRPEDEGEIKVGKGNKGERKEKARIRRKETNTSLISCELGANPFLERISQTAFPR
jgi:hypothetical protein